MFSFDAIPVIVGVATVLTVAVVAHFFFSKKYKVKGARKLVGRINTLKNPDEKYLLPLIEKVEISHDTRRFRFGLPSNKHVLGLPIGQHINLIANINDELVIRPYTPVTSDEHAGYADLVIKVYKSNVHPKFPNGGKMSQYLDSLKIGDTIAFRGPTGKLKYINEGRFLIQRLRKDPPVEFQVDTINMIAGGTGITPMLQLIREILVDAKEKVKLSLISANQTEDDILLRDELDELAEKHSDQFKVWYTVDKGNDTWKYSVGFVNADMIKEHLEPPSDHTAVLMCGPPPMINYACIPNLDALGYSPELRFAY